MTTAVLVLARMLHIGSAMLLVALPFFTLVILQADFSDGKSQRRSRFFCKMIRWFWLCLLLEALSGLLWFWLVAAQMSDHSPWQLLDAADLNAVLWQTQFGQLWLGRAAIGILLVVVLYFISSGKTPSHSYRNWLALAVSTSLLTTLAWAGHAVAGIHNHVLHLAADILHLLLGSIWPGGLVPLGCFLWEANQENQPWVGGSQTGTLQRFSQFSLVTVFLLLITGFINGWLMIGSWIALFTSTYGQLLLVKVLVVFLMIGLGTYNRLCVLPHFEGDPGFLSKLRGTVLTESFLALIVVLIVAIMGTTAPPA